MKLATLALAALSIAAAQTRPTTPTTGPVTTGTPQTGATVPGKQSGEDRNHAVTPTTTKQTSGHIPRTAAAPASTATTHSGSTPIAADQSKIKTRHHVKARKSRRPPSERPH
jgi:hypothetical protein